MIGQIVFFLLFGITLVIAARIAAKAGFSPWWGLVAFVPLGAVVAIWVLAWKRWPSVDGPKQIKPPTAP